MLGDKAFDIDKDDNIIIDGARYGGTPGFFELIFKRIPYDATYTNGDKQKYKSILLTTNAHRHGHNAENPILSNKGYKYKHVIAPLLSRVSTMLCPNGHPSVKKSHAFRLTQSSGQNLAQPRTGSRKCTETRQHMVKHPKKQAEDGDPDGPRFVPITL